MAQVKQVPAKDEIDIMIDEAIARFNANKGKTKVCQHIGEPVPPGEDEVFGIEVFGKISDQATRDAIRRFGEVIGDDNPLWRDEGYARRTRWGGITAPGTFLQRIAWGTGGYMPILPNTLYAHPPTGHNWDFFKPIHVGDTFTVYDTIGSMVERTQPGGPRQFLEDNLRTFINQRDEVVATCHRLMMDVYRRLDEKGKPEAITTMAKATRYKYSDEELEAIERAQSEERRRGAMPRYWEDVTVGEELDPVVHGPVALWDVILFAGSAKYLAESRFLAARRKVFPTGFYRRPDTRAYEFGGIVHFLDEAASGKGGYPMAVCYGEQSTLWVGHMLTNWMGDDGFLRKVHTRLYRVNPHGDTTWCRGKVARKYVADGRNLVDIEFHCDNQQGITHARGDAIVELPARAKLISF